MTRRRPVPNLPVEVTITEDRTPIGIPEVFHIDSAPGPCWAIRVQDTRSRSLDSYSYSGLHWGVHLRPLGELWPEALLVEASLIDAAGNSMGYPIPAPLLTLGTDWPSAAYHWYLPASRGGPKSFSLYLRVPRRGERKAATAEDLPGVARAE